MRKTFELFARLLSERLAAKVTTSEDSIRCTFFYALLSSTAYRHTEVIVENPHPQFKEKKIDFLITPRDDEVSIAIEFKYDRTIPSGQSINKTNRAGMFFNDLLRLAQLPRATASRRFFVYVTDSQMASYFRNPNNGFVSLFDLPMGKELQVDRAFFDGRPISFKAKVSCDFIPFKAISFYACDIGKEHLVRVWEIETLNFFPFKFR